MKQEIRAGLGIYINDLGSPLFVRTTSEANDLVMYEHGPAYILANKCTDRTLGQFVREALSKCEPGINKDEIDNSYKLELARMLKSLGLRNRSELFKKFKRCALYVYAHNGIGLETQKRDGRNNYSTFGEVRKIEFTASDIELGKAVRETLAASC